jgi:hypothetical protein
MALTNTINFLPEIFKSATNQRFLGATMDQLATDAINVPVNGYIGRTFAPTYKLGDNYVPDTTFLRSKYQLEPSVVVKNNTDVVLNSGYFDLLQSISNQSGYINNHQRLFKSEYYNYDGHFDYDKFVNYSNYYWLPNGPDSVYVTSLATPYQGSYTVTRNTAVGGYTFTNNGGHPNTMLTLARGGTYTFNVSQPGFKFWIQLKPGTSGIDPNVSTLSTRQILGINNNGTDNGVIQFNVPQATAQDFYNTMPIAATVDAAVTFKYTDIQNQLLSTFLNNFPMGIDGITNLLQNKTFIFIGNQSDSASWTTPSLPSGFVGTTSSSITPGSVIPNSTRTDAWQIILIPSGSDYLIQVAPVLTILPIEKVFVGSGLTYASTQFWLNNAYQYTQVPAITATTDYLYYQDSSNPEFVGKIKLVDNLTTPINVNNDILGQTSYTSPIGVIFTNGLKVQFDNFVLPTDYANNEYYVEGVGTSIQLIPVNQLITPSIYSYSELTTPDYITCNRASQDKNPWSRSNRWFHKDVLQATANYNNTSINYGPNIAGRRAIIEFEPNLQLFNFGKQAKNNVDLITFDSTDAFLYIEGQSSYTLNGTLLTQGMRIIFANDYDTNVVNKIWQVDIEIINSVNYIRLILTNDDPVNAGENVLTTQGITAGKTFWFDGTSWHECQEKTSINQAPLFDLVDADGNSFSDNTVYPGTNFTGTKLFSYAIGTGTNDSILGFPLTYKNFNNIGDIVFNNFYDTDTFTYNTSTLVKCNSGYIIKNIGLLTSKKLNNWVIGVESSNQYQTITKFFEGYVVTLNNKNYAFVQIDILPKASVTIPHLKVYLNNTLLNPYTDYEITTYGVYPVVIFYNTPAVGDKIDISIFSDDTSQLGTYDIPKNLDFNPLNQNFSEITLGQLRTHYNKLIENTTLSPSTAIPEQDRYLKAQGGTLLQQSSSPIYAMTFLTDSTVNFVNGITLARKEYQRFKNKFLSLCNSLTNLDYNNPKSGVDIILQNINAVKNNSFPWYYSDMVPQGFNYKVITYTVLNVKQKHYEIDGIFDITKLSNRAVLVYHNNVQLIGAGIEYSYNPSSPEIILNIDLIVGDTITIYDYTNTDGNYIPDTPVKLGLAQDYPPAIYQDTTYRTPISVILGHDGSITPAFGDFRDQYLLELEKRIYNNLKTDYNNLNSLNLFDTMPGRFRNTDYSLDEWNKVISQNFLQWTGSNNIDYTTNSWYNANDPWTWNYSKFTDVIDGSYLQGSWRAIYKYWFDTDQPHITPWEMLGFAEKPAWWSTRYGPAPYTNGNTTLWEDLEAGYIWNGSNSAAYIDTRFARPGLINFIPADNAGNLCDPTQCGLVNQLNLGAGADNFLVGEQGPVETAWRRSSDYPYAVQQALAILRPAEYFSTQLDLSRFYNNPVTNQFSNIVNQKISPTLLTVNGDTSTTPGTVLRTAGYLNWIADYIKNLGIDPVIKIEEYFSNFSVQLAYKVGGFTDQNLITVTAEQTSPGSTNASVIIPNENYTVYLGKPVPVATIKYSAVVITKTDTGYSISGYDTATPFFTILPSIANNKASVIKVNDVAVNIYQTSETTPTNIPYGTVFGNLQQVSDFLISYQRYLIKLGFQFTTFDTDLILTRDWLLSVQEFLFWAQQGWGSGTVIVLNPIINQLVINSVGTIVDEITNLPLGSKLLDANFTPIKTNNFNITRIDYPSGNQTLVTTVDPTTSIAFAQINLIQYENTLIFDNVDNFGDIIYIPEQGTRQYRLKITGVKTGGWDGALSPAGYIYSNPVINTWQPGTDYKQGDIVTFNNSYYTAPIDIVASQNFALSSWTQISLSSIQTGLLPSFGHNAQIFQNIYDVDNPPQDKNFQLYSAGLIGFRERPFLSNLSMSIPTQTKFYQGYITQKGTSNAINALTKATFDTINSTIDTYEEWAFRVGQYGDIDNNPYREFILDQQTFLTNPVAFTLTANTYSAANILVNLSLGNIYNASNLSSTSTSLYNNRNNEFYITDLPSPGYVNLNDVDYQIFDITKLSQLPVVGTGEKIWFAKDFAGHWNVHRLTESDAIATTLQYALDSYAQLTFNNRHGFNVNDYFVLQQFNSSFDGLYRVISIPSAVSVTIEIQKNLSRLIKNNTLTGSGSIHVLKSMVVDSVTEIDGIRPPHDWIDNDRVWVNNLTTDSWGVYTFNKPWVSNVGLIVSANTVSSGTHFGTATAISSDNSYLYVGDPGTTSVQVFADSSAGYSANTTIINTNNIGFGSSIDTQGNLLVVGAPESGNVVIYRQNDLNTSQEHTYTWANVTNWVPNLQLPIGSYILYNHFTYITTGNINASAFLLIEDAVTLTNAPNIQPGNLITYAGNTYITSGSVIASDFNTLVTAGNVRLLNTQPGGIGQLQTIKGFNTTFGSTVALSADQHWLYIGQPKNNLVCAYYTATPYYANSQYTFVANITTTSNIGDNFGAQVKTINDGSQVVIGAPNAFNTYESNGNVYIYSRSANTFALNQTISSQFKNINSQFGTSIGIDSTAGNIFVGAPNSNFSGYTNGVVERWINTGGTYTYNTTIQHPDNSIGRFGTTIALTADAQVLAVGSAGSSTVEATTFDNSTTLIDTNSTIFVEAVFNSGVVYMFEPLINQTIDNDTGLYIYTQELNAQVHSGDNFGSGISATRNIILSGAPGAGNAHIFENYDASMSWKLTRQQQPLVDITSINRTFIYNKTNNVILSALDFIDPAKGKVLNAAGVDIDFQTTTDPALYNNGNLSIQPSLTIHPDYHWASQQVGKIWWNIDAVRYINYEQDSLIYRLNHWGEPFPGSQILVCEWVESSVLPSQYVASGGNGIPLYADDSAYSTYGSVGPSGSVNIKYYFWVVGKTSINNTAGKSNSVYSIAAAIENPQAQGIAYATVLRNDTLALYNIDKTLMGQNSVLHIGGHTANSGLIHSEYSLVQEGNPKSKMPSVIERKLIDSLAGQDSAGNIVPDPALTPAQAYGISIRPRQSMFIDRQLALSNYITFVNTVIAGYPIVENKLLTTLNSGESTPLIHSGAYSQSVASYAELQYVDTTLISSGYNALVTNDETNQGKWAIYTWSGTAWSMTRLQSYKTNLYWNYIDWYESYYDYTIAPDITVANKLKFGQLTLIPNTTIKVLNNGNNQFEIYSIDSHLNQTLVGLQNGTLQLSTDTIPPLELRQIASAIQNEIFVDDLSVEYNKLFFAMVKYALTEQKNLEWVFKTSFINATQYIRALAQFPSYVADNQQYYLDYINEVKPYRSVVREFVVNYLGNDQFSGDTTDFDLPPYWDANLKIYRSPNGEQPYDANLLSSATSVYSQWYNNYKYQVVDVLIENAGIGYFSVPQITIVGDAGVNATAHATIDGNGGIASIIIDTPGKNYTSTPTILINGVGVGASAKAILKNVFDGSNQGHNLIRSLNTTIKFDRTTYTTSNTFVFWSNVNSSNIGQTLAANTIIVNNNNLYVLANAYTIDANVNFPLANVITINSSTFNNANDRIVAYNGYINLATTQSGLEYPGVKIDGNTFTGNIFDSSIQSFYGNTLGVNPYDINIDGGSYVTTFSSHAPEELIPGYMRDSLNLTVYDTGAIAFREFKNLSGNLNFYRIASANITTLSSNLNLTDSDIYVVNASILPLPNTGQNTPGIVFINGEKITYWRNYALEPKTAWSSNVVVTTNTLITYNGNIYLTTGNVYAAYFANILSNVTQVAANTLSQIRRGVDGTYSPAIQLANSRVVDSSIQQFIPNSTPVSANIGALPKAYNVTGNVSYQLSVINTISANVGDYITQHFANTSVAANLRVLGNVVKSNVVPVIITGGNITTLANTITINGTQVNANVAGSSILGTVNRAGNITIAANTVLANSLSWYSTSSSLDSSTTMQANFLKASPGFTPTHGTTP